MPSCRREGQLEGRQARLQGGAEHDGANEIVGQQPRHPFFFRHRGGFALQLHQAHLSFQIAQVQLDVPAKPVEDDQFLGRKSGVQTGEQVEGLGAKARAVDPRDDQTSPDGIGGTALLQLVLAGVRPEHIENPQPERAAQKPASPLLGHADKNLGAAGGPGGLDDAEDAKIAVADIKEQTGILQDKLGGQDLLAHRLSIRGIAQNRAGVNAEQDEHAHQAPVSRVGG